MLWRALTSNLLEIIVSDSVCIPLYIPHKCSESVCSTGQDWIAVKRHGLKNWHQTVDSRSSKWIKINVKSMARGDYLFKYAWTWGENALQRPTYQIQMKNALDFVFNPSGFVLNHDFFFWNLMGSICSSRGKKKFTKISNSKVTNKIFFEIVCIPLYMPHKLSVIVCGTGQDWIAIKRHGLKDRPHAMCSEWSKSIKIKLKSVARGTLKSFVSHSISHMNSL